MRTSDETKRFDKIVKMLPTLDDESLRTISLLATQLCTARANARHSVLTAGAQPKLGTSMPQLLDLEDA
jgi:hypothetical protein